MFFWNFFLDCFKQKPIAFLHGSIVGDPKPIQIEKAPVLDPTWKDSMRSATSSPTSVSAIFDQNPAQGLSRTCEYLYAVLTLYDRFDTCFNEYTVEAMLIFVSNYRYLLDNPKNSLYCVKNLLDSIEQDVKKDVTKVLSKQQTEDLLLRALFHISDAKYSRLGTEKITYYLKKEFNTFFHDNRYKFTSQYQNGYVVQNLFKKFSKEIVALPWSPNCKKTLPVDLFRLQYFSETKFNEDGYPIGFDDINRCQFRPISPNMSI
ncbi:MAG: hypothetical protein VX112_02445 [Pseudomonadota bacterium]|nr:hypothetical protein [Pseudomonadota bacterium]